MRMKRRAGVMIGRGGVGFLHCKIGFGGCIYPVEERTH